MFNFFKSKPVKACNLVVYNSQEEYDKAHPKIQEEPPKISEGRIPATYINNIKDNQDNLPLIIRLEPPQEIAVSQPTISTNAQTALATNLTYRGCEGLVGQCDTNVTPIEEKDKPFPLYHPKSFKEGVAINSLSKQIRFRGSKQQCDYLESKSNPSKFLRHLINRAMQAEIQGKKIFYELEEYSES